MTARRICRGRTLGVLALLAGSLAPALAGCGTRAAAVPENGVRVVLRDFRIDAPTRPITAGDVTFVVVNRGPTVHELVLARTTLRSADLPIGPDGLSVSEDSPRVTAVDELEHVALHTRSTLTVHLRPGHYVLFCNLEGHYLGGMHADLTVVR